MDSLAPLAADRIAALETERAQLVGQIAPLQERVDAIDRSLDGIRLLLDPQQIALPLPGIGEAEKLGRVREPSATGEAILRRAASNPGGVVIIARTGANRGEIKSASSLATGKRPLLVEAERIKGQVSYRLTEDGEAVARAFPVKGGEHG